MRGAIVETFYGAMSVIPGVERTQTRKLGMNWTMPCICAYNMYVMCVPGIIPGGILNMYAWYLVSSTGIHMFNPQVQNNSTQSYYRTYYSTRTSDVPVDLYEGRSRATLQQQDHLAGLLALLVCTKMKALVKRIVLEFYGHQVAFW